MSPSPLDDFWTGVLSLLAPIITPDWGKLVGLIPLLLLLLLLAYLGRLAAVWVGLYRAEPVRTLGRRRRSIRPLILAHAAVVVVGVAIAVTAFVLGARDANWQGSGSPLGLVVNVPLLLAGLVITVAAAGSGIRLWDRNGRDDLQPDAVDRGIALVRRYPGRAKRIAAFAVGVVLSAAGLALGTVPGVPDADRSPAVLPLLLLGLVLAVGAVGSAIAGVWSSDPDFDASESGPMATTHH